jgi:D-psicose/D-tagatose/L-ribulose 3-epimerase
MKIAVSNIGWNKKEEVLIAKLLSKKEIKGVEVVPAKLGPNPFTLSDKVILDYKFFWNDQGIEVIAMQALLFGSIGLAIFEGKLERLNTLNYLKRIIEIGGLLGAQALVFGSPRNRRINNMAKIDVEQIAIPFFKELGDYALQHKTHICLEPSPKIYDCDFITSTQQAINLVNQVNSLGFKPHFDSAAITLGQESLDLISKHRDMIIHFHASEAYLEPVINNIQVNHQSFSNILAKNNYQGYISIEMKEVAPRDSNLAAITKSIDFVKKVYGNIYL